MKKIESNMVNIPCQSLIVVEEIKDVKYCNVRFFASGVIQLTGFAVTQLLEGAELMVADNTVKLIDANEVKLILLLSKSLEIFQHVDYNDYKVDNNDLRILRKWLELRMIHCEKERDERTVLPWDSSKQKFNPDTYIGQKLLLLDLRELLIGEILSHE